MDSTALRTIVPPAAVIPGVLLAFLIAMASQFISEHYGAPAMLMALLFGIALNFLSTETRAAAGIAWTSRTLLRLGVALLGLRISVALLADIGLAVGLLVVGGVIVTILFGFAVSRVFGFRFRFAFLSAGSVAICGASAALAIAAILPRDERSEDRLVFTVVGVTVLSTLAMIVYPVVLGVLDLPDRAAGIFIGATVHDVAQVVGAGYSISTEAGDTATVVKLFRVLMLAPVVMIGALAIRAAAGAEVGQTKAPLVPAFVLGFLGLAALSSTGVVPAAIIDAGSEASRWLLLTAIAAVGLKTVPGEVLKVGPGAALLLLSETLFIAGFIAAGLYFMPATLAP